MINYTLKAALMCCVLSSQGNLVDADKWDPVRAVLADAIATRVFPGAVAMVDDGSGNVFLEAVGNHTYGFPTPLNPTIPGIPYTSPPVTTSTLFDMASLTKVVATTSATMLLYQKGLISLDAKVSSILGPNYSSNGKDGIAVRNLLLHNAGFPPDPVPDFWAPEFKCPATLKGPHPIEDFSCQSMIFDAVLNQTLEYPTGSQYIYSDLSMITMMYVVGTIVQQNNLVSSSNLNPACVGQSIPLDNLPGPKTQCYYEAFVRTHVLEEIDMTSSGFLPNKSVWKDCAPAWNDTDGDSPGPAYRHRIIQGQVSDGNSYALGGIAGHAGLFATASDAMRLGRALVFPSATFINASTVSLFTTPYNLSQSSRALGWDTNNYKMNTYRGCGNFSQQTFTHTGYTGTQICNDPTNKVITVLLTNRVYPIADENSINKIHHIRQRYNNAVLEALHSHS